MKLSKALIRDQMIGYYENVTDEALQNLKNGKSFDFSQMKNHSLMEKMDKSLSNLRNDRPKINRYLNDMNKMVNIAQKDYNKTLNRLLSTENDITRQKILSDYANHGIHGFTARNGAKWNLETYSNMYTTHWNNEFLRRNLLDKVGNNKYQKVEISSHNNSCPLCEPYQGRILTMSEFEDAQTAGLFHIRCKHYAIPVLEFDINVDLKKEAKNTESKMWDNINTETLFRRWFRRAIVAFIRIEIEKCRKKLLEYKDEEG